MTLLAPLPVSKRTTAGSGWTASVVLSTRVSASSQRGQLTTVLANSQRPRSLPSALRLRSVADDHGNISLSTSAQPLACGAITKGKRRRGKRLLSRLMSAQTRSGSAFAAPAEGSGMRAPRA
jgi:hypothetical protein